MGSGLLMRTCLDDVGQIPAHCTYSSPDVIIHEQVANHKTVFSAADSYSNDPNQQLKSGQAVNFMYARCKNLSSVEKKAYMHLYASRYSLFLNPSQWKQTKLKTQDGKGYTQTDTIPAGGVGVGNELLIIDGQLGRPCIVGIVLDQTGEPDIPDKFSSYDDYTKWIKENTHICMNNLYVLNTPVTDYESLDDFSNPGRERTPILFMVSLDDAVFPDKTKIVVECSLLGINETFTYKASSPLEKAFTVSGVVPVGYSGYIRTSVFLPSGSKWPEGGMVNRTVFAGVRITSVAARYAIAPETMFMRIKPENSVFKAVGADKFTAGLLIPVGVCGTVYKRA